MYVYKNDVMTRTRLDFFNEHFVVEGTLSIF